MSAQHAGGAPAPADGTEHSPFGIYRNALDFVMSNQSLDAETAARVILNEMGPYANDWQKLGIRSIARESGTGRPRPRVLDWRLAWLG